MTLATEIPRAHVRFGAATHTGNREVFVDILMYARV